MAFIEGTDRFQAQLLDFFAFDNLIADDNPVRAIDAFVDSLDLDDLGFITYSVIIVGKNLIILKFY